MHWAFSSLSHNVSKIVGCKVMKSHICKRERVTTFPHTTILQQKTLNIFCQKMENLYNWMDILWLKVENIVAKGKIARFEQFLLLSLCFQKVVCCSGVSQKASLWGKGLSSSTNIFFTVFRMLGPDMLTPKPSMNIHSLAHTHIAKLTAKGVWTTQMTFHFSANHQPDHDQPKALFIKWGMCFCESFSFAFCMDL